VGEGHVMILQVLAVRNVNPRICSLLQIKGSRVKQQLFVNKMEDLKNSKRKRTGGLDDIDRYVRRIALK